MGISFASYDVLLSSLLYNLIFQGGRLGPLPAAERVHGHLVTTFF